MQSEKANELLAALPEDGTSMSNKRLAERLGFSKEDYERCRDELLKAGLVRKAPGKGGSLRRVVAGGASEIEADEAVADEATDDGEAAIVAEGSDTSGLPKAEGAREEFALQLHLDIEALRGAGRRTLEQALLEYAIDSFGDEQFDEPTAYSFVDIDSFNGEVRLRFDGYDLHEDDDDDRDVIDLFVVHVVSPIAQGNDGKTRIQLPTFDGAPVNALFRAARRFVEEARSDLYKELGHDPEARDVARSIRASKNLVRVNINLVTNAEVKQFDRSSEKIEGIEIVKRALDINSLRRLFSPDQIEIDFSVARPGGMPCVPLPEPNNTYRSFLAIVPGAFLSQLYDRYKQRLLEANVRAYLRAANKSVNHKIIETIKNSPERFFAYNNGITATADELVVEQTADGGWALIRCRNLQIVNGGQTTASLFHATLRKISLDRVFVAMKINEVLDRSRATEIVQQISVSANSQNKINLSDLGANMAFHVELQKHAQAEVPPVPATGIPTGGKWFYERMRGQYQNSVTLEGTPARKRKFQQEFPKAQVITKTDVAKYHMAWAQLPFNVCYGAEKNYQRFRQQIAEKFVPDAAWFRALVAKAILFECCDSIVASQKVPGFKANIVAYTVALLAHEKGSAFDLEAVWRAQTVDQATQDWFREAIGFVREHITRVAREGKNAGEWSKKEKCWTDLCADWAARPR